MDRREKILLNKSHQTDFNTLTHTVSQMSTITLKAPVTSDGIILLNARLGGKPKFTELSMYVQPDSVEISRYDYGGIQAFNAGAENGPVAPMLRKPAGTLRVESDDNKWLLDERPQDILDMYTMNYFLDIVAAYALKKHSEYTGRNYYTSAAR